MQLLSSVYRPIAVFVLLAATLPAFSQQPASQTDIPSAPSSSSGPKFPPVDPKNFSTSAPSRETVEAFLRVSWGYDTDRVWQVQAIQKTPAPGISKVTALVAQKSDPQQQVATLVFYVTPDEKHLISNSDVLPFGAMPYADTRRILTERADGHTRGPADKKFELVEFADLQCPHCKAVQPTIERLIGDFPQAHFVFENLPLTAIHTEAYKAATYATCVAQQAGNDAFFKFIDAVFAAQEGLTPETSDATLADVVTKIGLDPAKVGSCSYTSAAKAPVDASIKLAEDLEITETPMLFINGRQIPIGEVANGQLPYDTLKKIVAWQFSLDQ
ncbi:MAG: thioredoxin domain-containing protein [Silvibacterium sp.]|nr:thioredoxin domain-containing protein [Silvibacterium sp.]